MMDFSMTKPSVSNKPKLSLLLTEKGNPIFRPKPHLRTPIKRAPVSSKSCVFCSRLGHASQSHLQLIISKALSHMHDSPQEISYLNNIDKILFKKSSTIFLDFKEIQFNEEEQLLRRFYSKDEVTEKFRIIWKFYQFSIITPKLYRLISFPILRKNLMYKKRKREETMRKILDEISDADIEMLNIEYVLSYERNNR